MKKINQPVLDQLTRARAGMILDQPFFGHLSLRLKLVENHFIPTLGVDGKHIFYNPEFVKTLDQDLTKAVIAHEVGHCIFDHINRRGARDKMKFNIAGDYVINLILTDAGFNFKGHALLDQQYRGMSTDHVYSLLPNVTSEEIPGLGQPGGALCDIMDGVIADEADATAQARDWHVAVIQAAQSARLMGKLPATLERFITGLLKPQVDWKTILRRFITQHSRADYSWARPNRRMLSAGFYLPSLYSESMGELVIAVDTSGSVDGPTLNAFSAEGGAIIADCRPAKTHVIYCDARINKIAAFSPDDIFKLEAVGGGGTDFRPPFEYIEEHGIEPVCLVYLTDGYGPFGDAPSYPVLWACTTNVTAPWGETLKIEV